LETDANTVDMDTTVRVLYVDGSTRAPETVTALERETDRLAVEQVSDPDEALARLTSVDCLVAAHDTPEQDGMALLGRVRESHPNLPVVLFAADSDERLARDVLAAGPSEFVRRGEAGTHAVLASRIERLVAQRATGDGGETGREETDDEFRQRLLAVVADPDATPDEKTGRLLELGCERFGTENGHLVKIDRDSGRHEVVSVFGSEIITEGVSDLSTTYCRRTIDSPEVLNVYNAPAEGWEDDPAYQKYGLCCYIGQKVLVEDELYGTVCFASERPRQEEFSRAEREFMDLFGRLFGQLLERRRRRAQAETVFEHTQDALFLVDVTRDGAFRIRQVNEVYEEITGRSTADIRGKTPTEIVGERQGARLEERCRHCVETREAIDYEDQIRIDAETRHWHTTLAPVVEDDEVVQLVGATRDVTEQRERERTLAARNRAMEKAPVGITISDPDQEDNPLVYVNEEYEDMTGYDEAEVDGRNCRFLQGEGTDPEPVRQMREAVDAREPVSVELRNYRKDGTEFWNRVDIAPVFDEDGDLLQFVGYQQDVTERVEYARQLEAQNERLDQFVSLVSHDLRNPLDVAGTRLDLAQQKRDSEHLDAVEGALDRMETLVEDLLTLARGGKQDVEPESIPLGVLAEQCWAHVETGDVTLDVASDRTVEANRDRLSQLLENLFRNALEHGGDVTTITVGALEDGFYVEDDGQGIPEADRDRVFEDGYSTSRDGTGFGLSIVSEFAAARGWTVSVTEGDAGGARFEILTE
jgi:PAS domain S-box-containing protein